MQSRIGAYHIARCVLLDSVQSQANRMEELLQEAMRVLCRAMPKGRSQRRSRLRMTGLRQFFVRWTIPPSILCDGCPWFSDLLARAGLPEQH